MISRFMHQPSKQYFGAAKRILHYVLGTSNFGIWYFNHANIKLFGFSDSDWIGSIDDRRSTFRFFLSLRSGGIAWTSKKQATLALLSPEVKYTVAASSACQAI